MCEIPWFLSGERKTFEGIASPELGILWKYFSNIRYFYIFYRNVFLLQNFDIKVVQTWTGCVIAASVIAFPLMYRNTRAAFEQVDVNLIYAGRTLGMSESRIFWKVIMPAAGPGIASGTVLAFARAIGEYGATSMLAGNILGKTRTVSVAIASETAAGNFDMAGFWVVVIILISFLVVAAINIVSGRGMQTRRWI